MGRLLIVLDRLQEYPVYHLMYVRCRTSEKLILHCEILTIALNISIILAGFEGKRIPTNVR